MTDHMTHISEEVKGKSKYREVTWAFSPVDMVTTDTAGPPADVFHIWHQIS